MKNLEKRDGFLNRHTDGIPSEITIIRVVNVSSSGEDIFLCEWKPFKPEHRTKNFNPGTGYLGTAKVVEGRWKGIGFHMWEQNDSEFVYYALV